MNAKATIILIEDEKGIRNFMETTLAAHDYQVTPAVCGRDGLSLITSMCPDLILLDLGLPDMDGMDVILKVREWSTIPILVISARTDEHEKVLALDSGADDYITKPFGTPELLARIRSALRHRIHAAALPTPEPIYQFDGLTIDFEKRLVIMNGEEVHLTQIEYKLVSLLAQNAGKVLTYDSIMKQIWGPYTDNNNQILRVNMAHIRRKLEVNPAEPHYIFTEIGVGYRMKESN